MPSTKKYQIEQALSLIMLISQRAITNGVIQQLKLNLKNSILEISTSPYDSSSKKSPKIEKWSHVRSQWPLSYIKIITQNFTFCDNCVIIFRHHEIWCRYLTKCLGSTWLHFSIFGLIFEYKSDGEIEISKFKLIWFHGN